MGIIQGNKETWMDSSGYGYGSGYGDGYGDGSGYGDGE